MSSTSTSAKRPYVRLTPAAWAEIVAKWQSGEFTLAQLSHGYHVTTRAIQSHLAKNKIEKGSQAKVIAAKVKAEVFKATLPEVEATVDRAIAIRERAYNHAVVIEDQIIATLKSAADDPSTVFAASATIKMLGVAAQSLERLHTLKRAACGIGADDAGDGELPVLTILDLTADEIADLQRQDDEDDPGNLVTDDADTDLVTLE